MAPAESDGVTFAAYRRVLDHRKVRDYFLTIVEDEAYHEETRDIVGDFMNRCLAGDFYPDEPGVGRRC